MKVKVLVFCHLVQTKSSASVGRIFQYPTQANRSRSRVNLLVTVVSTQPQPRLSSRGYHPTDGVWPENRWGSRATRCAVSGCSAARTVRKPLHPRLLTNSGRRRPRNTISHLSPWADEHAPRSRMTQCCISHFSGLTAEQSPAKVDHMFCASGHYVQHSRI